MMLMTLSDLPLKRIARGKVRDVYEVEGDRLLLVATDRISAYDVVMAEPDSLEGRGADPGQRLVVPPVRGVW